MDFEWDENKNAQNRIKHGIDFNDAIETFYDHNGIAFEDDGDYGEQRIQIIGMSSRGILFVEYTERYDDIIRIISARKATKREQCAYRDGAY